MFFNYTPTQDALEINRPRINEKELEMNIVNFGEQQRTMNSREIADLTGKQHKHVLEDVRKMLEDLDLSSAGFAAQYKDSTNRTLPCFNLPKRETLILVSGYSIPMRARIIDRWQELEAKQAPQIPQTYAAALLEAGRLALEVVDRECADRLQYFQPTMYYRC